MVVVVVVVEACAGGADAAASCLFFGPRRLAVVVVVVVAVVVVVVVVVVVESLLLLTLALSVLLWLCTFFFFLLCLPSSSLSSSRVFDALFWAVRSCWTSHWLGSLIRQGTTSQSCTPEAKRRHKGRAISHILKARKRIETADLISTGLPGLPPDTGQGNVALVNLFANWVSSLPDCSES